MNRCQKCILDSKMPGVIIDTETEICQFCQKELISEKKSKNLDTIVMENLLNETNQNGRYDVIFALSGGKDSVFTLYQLKSRYPHLRILAILFNNGFISPIAIDNARMICSLISCDIEFLSIPGSLFIDGIKKAAHTKGIFPPSAIKRASDVCNLCMSTIKQKLIERALKENIPIIAFGFSPGQTDAPIIALSSSMIKWNRNLFSSILTRMGMDSNKDAFLMDTKYIKDINHDCLIYIIHPLCVWGYNKKSIISKCKEIGWKSPDIKDPNSTNCLLNSFAIQNHLEKYGFHPYAFDLATLVRLGLMERDEALRTINTIPSKQLIELIEMEIDAI